MPKLSSKPQHRRTVLVVDDHPDCRTSMGEMLRVHGFHVIEAGDGAAAVKAARDHEPSVIFMDLDMRPVDGWDATRAIRALAPAVRPYIAALTGWGRPADRDRSAAAGVDVHLLKPADPGTVLKVARDNAA